MFLLRGGRDDHEELKPVFFLKHFAPSDTYRDNIYAFIVCVYIKS